MLFECSLPLHATWRSDRAADSVNERIGKLEGETVERMTSRGRPWRRAVPADWTKREATLMGARGGGEEWMRAGESDLNASSDRRWSDEEAMVACEGVEVN